MLRAGDGVRALVERAAAGGLRAGAGRGAPRAGAVVADGRRVLEADQRRLGLRRLAGAAVPRARPAARDAARTSSLFDAGPEWAGAPGWLDFDASAYGHGLIEPYGLKVASDREGAELEPGLRPPQRPTPAWSRRPRDYLAARFPALAGAARALLALLPLLA